MHQPGHDGSKHRPTSGLPLTHSVPGACPHTHAHGCTWIPALPARRQPMPVHGCAALPYVGRQSIFPDGKMRRRRNRYPSHLPRQKAAALGCPYAPNAKNHLPGAARPTHADWRRLKPAQRWVCAPRQSLPRRQPNPALPGDVPPASRAVRPARTGSPMRARLRSAEPRFV